MTTLIEMKGISKSFGSICALQDVDFSLGSGEIVGLLGDNGAGKSTLIKVLSGFHRPESGTMNLLGREIDFSRYTPAEARKQGIETVYQEKSLGEKQPLWRNVFVGRHLTNRLGFIQARREKEETLKLLSSVLGLRGVGLDPEATVSTLSGGERQGLAIGRAMYFGAEIIVLDEPTTALALKEVEKVLEFIEGIRTEGKSCIIISHDLEDVYRVADRFVIMDRGRIVGRYAKDDIDLEGLMGAMLRHANGEGKP